MRKLWLAIGLYWLISVIYFITYVNMPSLQTAVNASSGLSILHFVMDMGLLGGGFALIMRIIYGLTHKK